jgi:hypothetical protein
MWPDKSVDGPSKCLDASLNLLEVPGDHLPEPVGISQRLRLDAVDRLLGLSTRASNSGLLLIDLPPLNEATSGVRILGVAATKGGQEMPRGKPEQAEHVMPKLREVEVELGRGKTVAEALKKIDVTEQT